MQPRLAARTERAGRGRHVDVVVTRVLRNRWKDADHGVRPVVHFEDGAHDVRVAAEALLPVRVAEQQHRFGPQVVVGVHERATEERLHPKHIEEVGGHDAGEYAVRFTPVEQGERHPVVLDKSVQTVELIPIVDDLLDREWNVLRASAKRLLSSQHQFLSILVRERLQEHPVDHAENRGVGANAQRQRHHDEQAVAGMVPEAACPIANVSDDGVDQPWLVDVRLVGATHA